MTVEKDVGREMGALTVVESGDFWIFGEGGRALLGFVSCTRFGRLTSRPGEEQGAGNDTSR